MTPKEAIEYIEKELRTRPLPKDTGLEAVVEVVRLAKAFLRLESWLDNLPTKITSMTPDFVLKKIAELKTPPPKGAPRDDLYRVKFMIADLLNERCYNQQWTHLALQELDEKINEMIKEK